MIQLFPVGHIRTPYTAIEACPRNSDPKGPLCSLVIDDQKRAALLGLSAGMDILILYWFEEVDRNQLRQESFESGEAAGVFSLRSPNRPNPIGAAVVRIEALENNVIQVRGLDCLDGTPLLDIKPARGKES